MPTHGAEAEEEKEEECAVCEILSGGRFRLRENPGKETCGLQVVSGGWTGRRGTGEGENLRQKNRGGVKEKLFGAKGTAGHRRVVEEAPVTAEPWWQRLRPGCPELPAQL